MERGDAAIDLVRDMPGVDCCDILLDMEEACGLDPYIPLEPGKREGQGNPTVVKFRFMA